MPSSPLLETAFADLALVRRGKVRDVYAVGKDLLIVATDRISAFDFVLGSGIPDKGRVLTQLSAFWFDRTRSLVPNHLITADETQFAPALRAHAPVIAGRSMLVHTTAPLPIECVARGYLSGSGWKDYVATGQVCGIRLPEGLRESERLPAPIFTPATKAASGHDQNIDEQEAAGLVGTDLLARLKHLTLALYEAGAAHAERRGIMLADTKCEFGITSTGDLLLIDELMTPDSSRYWPKDGYVPGRPQISFDKQYVRDYLEAIGWNKQPPVPTLPDDVVERTREKYLEAYVRLTGQPLHSRA